MRDGRLAHITHTVTRRESTVSSLFHARLFRCFLNKDHTPSYNQASANRMGRSPSWSTMDPHVHVGDNGDAASDGDARLHDVHLWQNAADVFEAMDTDRSGTISMDELQRMIMRQGYSAEVAKL